MTDTAAPILRVEGLSVRYPVADGGLFAQRRKLLRAVDGVSFDLFAGQTLGVVGETGCGKSSLGKAVLQLVRPAAGRVLWDGNDLCALSDQALKRYRRDLQIIFQDPLSSLNPRMPIGEIVGEPLRVHATGMSSAERERAVDDMLIKVGLRPDMKSRYPNEFSGGQCQRISIARAMIVQPRVIVCDEPVSSLDVSIQAQICNLLRQLQRETGVALIFISHDLSVVRYMSNRILVMYLGSVVETAECQALFDRPRHPYTRTLIASIPGATTTNLIDAPPLDGEPPSLLDAPTGCVFRSRCRHASPRCAIDAPEADTVASGHGVRCHHWREVTGVAVHHSVPATR